MKVNRINVEISTLANKHRTYLYNEMFSLAKEHQIQGEFGNDFISLKVLLIITDINVVKVIGMMLIVLATKKFTHPLPQRNS